MGSDSQLEMTPLQRQIFEAQKKAEAEEKREQMPDAGGNGRIRNSRHGSAGGRSHENKETVRYISEDENPEANVTFVD